MEMLDELWLVNYHGEGEATNTTVTQHKPSEGASNVPAEAPMSGPPEEGGSGPSHNMLSSLQPPPQI